MCGKSQQAASLTAKKENDLFAVERCHTISLQMIGLWQIMNWKGCGMWPSLRHYLGMCLEELRKTSKNLSEYLVSPLSWSVS
jgi:hypothetical protein